MARWALSKEEHRLMLQVLKTQDVADELRAEKEREESAIADLVVLLYASLVPFCSMLTQTQILNIWCSIVAHWPIDQRRLAVAWLEDTRGAAPSWVAALPFQPRRGEEGEDWERNVAEIAPWVLDAVFPAHGEGPEDMGG